MAYDSRIHHRRSVRLHGWDYATDGAYYITVCAQHRLCLFGAICGATMQVNEFGMAVAETWQWLASQYAYVALDEWCVMPNHLHGILILSGRGGSRATPTANTPTAPTANTPTAPTANTPTAPTANTPAAPAAKASNVERIKPIGQLIGAFKTVSTKRVNGLRGTPGETLWQRNYWEHIVRDEEEMHNLRTYIRNNPAQWAVDALNIT